MSPMNLRCIVGNIGDMKKDTFGTIHVQNNITSITFFYNLSEKYISG